MKKFYKDNQTLINIIGLVASILTIISFFIVIVSENNNISFKNVSARDINIDNSKNKTVNNNFDIKEFVKIVELNKDLKEVVKKLFEKIMKVF